MERGELIWSDLYFTERFTSAKLIMDKLEMAGEETTTKEEQR